MSEISSDLRVKRRKRLIKAQNKRRKIEKKGKHNRRVNLVLACA